jgi:hypothetical protein
MNPQIWFVHYRGIGNAIALAHAVHAALSTTSTPLPQAPPRNPTTPLDPNRLASILHGTASVGDEGVVTVWVYRRNLEMLKVGDPYQLATEIRQGLNLTLAR